MGCRNALSPTLMLLVNLGGTAWLTARVLQSNAAFETIDSWQMRYLPVFGVWAAIAVLILPILFRFG